MYTGHALDIEICITLVWDTTIGYTWWVPYIRNHYDK